MKNIIARRLKEFFFISKHYSVVFAFYGFIWWVAFYIRTPFSYRVSKYALKQKTKWLDAYINKNYSDILGKYSDWNVDCKQPEVHRIWVFWGQGRDSMPPLVEACYKQLTYYNDNVTLITNENINSFITIPPLVYNKVISGDITWANYSDIIRNLLLAKYGGLWLDATIWVPDKLPMEIMIGMSIYTANGIVPVSNKGVYFWTSDKWSWSSWCLWSRRTNNILYSFVGEMLSAIAIKEIVWPDYVIQDYLIHYACRNFKSVKSDMENMTIHNPHRGTLAEIMSKPYDEEYYKTLLKDEFVFKLSFRQDWDKVTKDGVQTFYGRILSDIIKI